MVAYLSSLQPVPLLPMLTEGLILTHAILYSILWVQGLVKEAWWWEHEDKIYWSYHILRDPEVASLMEQ